MGIHWDDSIGAVKEFDRKYSEIAKGIKNGWIYPDRETCMELITRTNKLGGISMSKRWKKLVDCIAMMQAEIDNLTEQVEQMQCEHECKVYDPRAVYTEGVCSMSFVYNEICNDCGKILRVGVTEEEYLKAKIAEAKQDAAEEISELEVALKKAREKKPVKKVDKNNQKK